MRHLPGDVWIRRGDQAWLLTGHGWSHPNCVANEVGADNIALPHYSFVQRVLEYIKVLPLRIRYWLTGRLP